jgi:hypothetical protein
LTLERGQGVAGAAQELPRAVGRDLVGPVEQFGVDAVFRDQAIDAILSTAAAFVTGDAHISSLPTMSRNVIAPARGIKALLSKLEVIAQCEASEEDAGCQQFIRGMNLWNSAGL